MMEHKRWFFLSLFLYPLSALSIVVPPYLVQQILDVAIPARDMDLFYVLAIVYLAAVAGEYITGFMSQLSMSILGQRSVLSLRTELYAHVQKMSASFFDRNPIGRTLTRLTNDTESLAEVFATGAVTILADVVVLIGIVSAMLLMDVKLTLFAFITLPVLVALVIFMQRKARVAFRSVRALLADQRILGRAS